MKKIFAVLFAMLLTACAGSGSIDWNDARKIKQGMTEKQLTDLMGKPYSIRAKADGTQIWVWVNVTAFAGGSSLAVPIKDGLVVGDMKLPESFK